MEETDSYLQTALELADIARDVISNAASDMGKPEYKPDGSPVTAVDKECERRLRDFIAAKHPQHAFWGEETGAGAPASEKWVIDPIDGTSSFISGSPLYTTLIGLMVDDVPVAGVIEMPSMARRWAGAGSVSFYEDSASRRDFNGQATESVELKRATVAITRPAAGQATQALLGKAGCVRYGGDGFNFACVADGSLDIAVDEGLKPFDFLPVIPVIEAAGGAVACFDGSRPTPECDGWIIAATSKALLDSALEVLNA